MTDTRTLLERHAAWQKGRAALTWPEKIRMAESVREWAAQLRRAGPPFTPGASASRRPGSGEGHDPRRLKDK